MKGRQLAAFEGSRSDQLHRRPARRTWDAYGGAFVDMADPVDLAAAFSSLGDPWSPRTVAVMNDDDVRVVRTHGDFTWHSHPDTDDLFIVLTGSLTIRLEDCDHPRLGLTRCHRLTRRFL